MFRVCNHYIMMLISTDWIDPKIVTSFVATGIGYIVKRLLGPKSNILWGVSHGFDFTINRGVDPFIVKTRTIIFQNAGRAIANNLQIHLNKEPVNFHVWPAIKYNSDKHPEGFFCFSIEKISPRETFSLEMLNGNEELPLVIRVKSDDGEGKQVRFNSVRVWSIWYLQTLRTLVFFGVFGLVMAGISILHIILKIAAN